MRDRSKQKYGHLWSKVKIDFRDRWLLDELAWSIHIPWGTPYIVGNDRVGSRTVKRQLHRVIMNAPSNVEVDHINGDTLDNRRCNLRLCTRAENSWNQKPYGDSSNFKGVCWDKSRRKWCASIMLKERRFRLGRYDDEEGAAFAYDVAARILFGEFARLNFQENDR